MKTIQKSQSIETLQFSQIGDVSSPKLLICFFVSHCQNNEEDFWSTVMKSSNADVISSVILVAAKHAVPGFLISHISCTLSAYWSTCFLSMPHSVSFFGSKVCWNKGTFSILTFWIGPIVHWNTVTFTILIFWIGLATKPIVHWNMVILVT